MIEYDELIGVSVCDNGEPMVVVQEQAPEIICRAINRDMQPYCGEKILLRSGVCQRLQMAAHSLAVRAPELKIRLGYGYRHPEVQRRYFERELEKIQEAKPGIGRLELFREVHRLVAVPDVAGHPCGAAVDVTLEGPMGELDMGGAFLNLENPKALPVFSSLIGADQLANRQLLRDAMLSSGFAPFDGEWWHFSYGDREWAAYYRKPRAMYQQICY